MIERLSIRNLILIEEVEISFGPGLNIITGETGSGKSAILSAIRLILGGRADVSLIRKGTELAVVEALVRINVGNFQEIELPADGREIAIRREIHSSGKSRCFVQDQLISLQQLRSLLASSIELVDQSASHKLLDPEEQRGFLDAFLGLDQEKKTCEEAFHTVKRAQNRLAQLVHLQEESGKDQDRMKDDLLFLERIHWQKGEEEQLVAEHNLLTHAQELVEKLSAIAEFLSEGTEPVVPALKRFAYQTEQLLRIEPKLQECAQGLRNACASLDESGRFLTSYIDNVNANPQRLDAIEKRISEIESAKRRFSKSQEELETLRVQLHEKLETIESLDEEIAAAKQSLKEAELRLGSAAIVLTEARKKGALQLTRAVLTELMTMNLPHARFSIELSSKEVSATGADTVSWLFAANPGQTPLSLDRCASGGELSRLLLALKIALAGKEKSSCLIFDEIDSNVGGKTAALLGEQLHSLSLSCQLICVTHFVQVAKCAMHHFLVQKETTGVKARTFVSKLDEPGRLAEYGRMTGIEE